MRKRASLLHRWVTNRGTRNPSFLMKRQIYAVLIANYQGKDRTAGVALRET